MKFIPILFSTPMVQAEQEGRKKMTRRVIKPQPDENGVSYMRNPPIPWVEAKGNEWKPWLYDTEEGERIATNCPYGQIGDVLWVRETFSKTYNRTTDKWDFIYKADGGWIGYDGPVKWKPSLFMPKAACRTFLEITNIRVERLQNISDKDAKAEGAKDHLKVDEMKMLTGLDNWIIPSPFSGYQFGFLSIWCKINGCESWLANPYVWVLEFNRIEKPENFI